jgi:xanthine dehydrogenase YagR molybdenum-binding subunit
MNELILTRDPAYVRHGSSIGQPLTRRDGLLKVTGKARYAADNHPPGMLHAVMAVSSIARGRIASLDVDAAKRHPGVIEVMTSQIRSCSGSMPCRTIACAMPTSRSRS